MCDETPLIVTFDSFPSSTFVTSFLFVIPYRSFKASSGSGFATLKPSSGLFWTAMSDQQDSEELFVHLRPVVFSFTGMFEFLKCQRVSVGGGAFAWFLF